MQNNYHQQYSSPRFCHPVPKILFASVNPFYRLLGLPKSAEHGEDSVREKANAGLARRTSGSWWARHFIPVLYTVTQVGTLGSP